MRFNGMLARAGSLIVLTMSGVPVCLAEISGTLSLTSNYFWRGYSKSDDKPAAQGFVDFRHASGFFAGAWLSQVDFDDNVSSDDADLEFSPYIGWGYSPLPDWSVDARFARYIYDSDIFNRGDIG